MLVTSRWRIVEMDLWDRDAIDLRPFHHGLRLSR
jgi:hypothetical protein